MSRPEKDRIINCPPAFAEFKPPGVPRRALNQIVLNIAEYEALRLADYEGRDQVDSAGEMEISRPTFTRLLKKARQKLCAMLVEGKSLTIEGGTVHFKANLIRCRDCQHVFRVKIDQDPTDCPRCGSTRLLSLAEQFGHGRCCRGRGNRRLR